MQTTTNWSGSCSAVKQSSAGRPMEADDPVHHVLQAFVAHPPGKRSRLKHLRLPLKADRLRAVRLGVAFGA